MAVLTESFPCLLSLTELVQAMTVDVMSAERRTAIEQAVASLTTVGLLELRGAHVVPTPPALRAGELEMGLA